MDTNDLNKYLRALIYVGLFGSLLIPLYVSSGMFFPFITGKNFAFRIIVEIVSALALILWMRDPEQKVKRSPLTLAVALFLIVISLATFLGENPYRSFWSNYERMDGLVNLLHQGLYFFVLVATLRSLKIWNWFLHSSLLVALLVALFGIKQLSGHAVINQGGVRVDATFGNATYLAVYMLFHVFIAAYYALRAKGQMWLQVGYGALAALFLFILYHTATRGVILGLIAGAVLSLVLVAWRSSGKVKTGALSLVAALVLLVVGFIGVRNSSFVKNSSVLSRFGSISLTETTTQSRFVIWNMALQGVKEHPLLGWGPENFNLVFNKYYEPELWKQETWFDRAHNAFFDWLVAGGILGLASYLAMFVAVLYLIWRRGSGFSMMEQSIFTGLFVAYFLQNLLVFDNLTSYMLFFIMLAYINSRAATSAPAFAESLGPWFENLRTWAGGAMQSVVASLLLVVLAFVIYFGNAKPIMANHLMIQALYPRALTEENLARFQKLFALKTFGSMESREQLLFLLNDLKQKSTENPTLFNQFYELGRTQMQEQLKQSGNDARHELFMGSFFQAFGHSDTALPYYEEAHKLSPKKQIIDFALMGSYIDAKRYSDALALGKEAYESDPTYDEARVRYAAVLVYVGQSAEAEKLLTERYGTALLPDASLIQAYVATNQMPKVIAIWKKALAGEPANPQIYLALTAAYYANHQDSLAIATLEEMSKLSADAKAAADFYIDAIRTGKLPRQ